MLVSPVSADTCPCRKVPAYLYCLQMNIPAAVCGRCSAAVLQAAGGHRMNNMQMGANCRNIHKTIAITAQQAAA